MSNNSSSDPLCPNISSYILELTSNTYLATYYAITPFYFLVSIFGDALLLISFRRQARKDNAYGYQFVRTISKILEAITFFLFDVTYKWFSGAEFPPGASWYTGNYVLMWYAAHGAIPVMNCFTTSSLLFSFVMAADRVSALAFPYKYKNLNHRTIQLVSSAICFGVGISSNIFDCFRYIVVPDGRSYAVGIDEAYVVSPVAMALSQVRMVIRVSALVGLIGLNVALTVMFRRRAKKVSQMTNNQDLYKEQARREADRTLVQLTVWQSLLTCLAIIPVNCCYIIAYFFVEIIICWGNQLFLLADLSFAAAESLDFFVILFINKKLRRMIANVLPWNRNRVMAINGNSMAVSQSQIRSTRLVEMSQREI